MANRILKTTLISVSTLVALSGLADAHPGHGAAGLAAGFAHPFSGLDHLAAMLAVGLLGARLGGRALWQVPLAFIAMMVLGGVLGMNGVALPFVEYGIAASVLVLVGAVVMARALPISAAVALAGLFAVFHGHAHGAEMPLAASGFAYGLGFVAASSLLIGAALLAGHVVLARRKTIRATA